VKSVVYPNSGDVIATSKMAAKAVLICRPNSHPFQVIVYWNYGDKWVFYGERGCIFICSYICKSSLAAWLLASEGVFCCMELHSCLLGNFFIFPKNCEQPLSVREVT
jgi:hypothetical protein